MVCPSQISRSESSQEFDLGLLGPNGAGKTTTIKLLLRLIQPSGGTATVFGLDIGRDSVAIRDRIGYLPQEPRYYEHMTARQNLRFAARFSLKGPAAEIEKHVAETLELVGLEDKADRPVKGFSGGERQRLGIGQAQVNHPDLLILDEPAASLDPLGRRNGATTETYRALPVDVEQALFRVAQEALASAARHSRARHVQVTLFHSENAVILQVPDVVLMDLVMPGLDGVETTRRLRRASPRSQVVVLTFYHKDVHIFPAIKAGALSYLHVDPEELAEAVRAAARGEAVLHPHVATRVMQEIRGARREVPNPFAELTDGEFGVMRLIAEGLSNALIAERLVLSKKTVKGYVSNILSKLHLADRTQAAVFAWREGMIRSD